MIQKTSVSQIRSISLSFQGLVIGIMLVFPALLSMDIGSVYFGFSFLPVAIIYYWPRSSSYNWSLISVFLLGLFYDMVSANTLGMWALAFLALYMFLDNVPNTKPGLGRAIAGFILSLMLCLVIVLLVGWISMGKLPQISTLLINAIATIIVFPAIYWVHNIITTLHGSSNALGVRR